MQERLEKLEENQKKIMEQQDNLTRKLYVLSKEVENIREAINNLECVADC